MPTITEHWEPADADSLMVVMRNRDKYEHERRLNEGAHHFAMKESRRYGLRVRRHLPPLPPTV